MGEESNYGHVLQGVVLPVAKKSCKKDSFVKNVDDDWNTGPDPINILQHKFYAMLIFEAIWLATQICQPIRVLKKFNVA